MEFKNGSYVLYKNVVYIVTDSYVNEFTGAKEYILHAVESDDWATANGDELRRW